MSSSFYYCFSSKDSVFLTYPPCSFSHSKFFVFYIPSMGVFWVLRAVPGHTQCTGEWNPGGRRLDLGGWAVLLWGEWGEGGEDKKISSFWKVEWKEGRDLEIFMWHLHSRIEGTWETNWMWGERDPNQTVDPGFWLRPGWTATLGECCSCQVCAGWFSDTFLGTSCVFCQKGFAWGYF